MNFYNFFKPLYFIVDWRLSPFKKVLPEIYGSLSGKSILEVGVGNGKQFHYYKKANITAIDYSEKMLQLAQQNYNEQNVQWILANIEEYELQKNAFDYINLHHILSIVKEPKNLLDKCAKALKPGGKIIIINHFLAPKWMPNYLKNMLNDVSALFHFKMVFDKSGTHSSILNKIEERKLSTFGNYYLIVLEKKENE